MKNNLYSKFRNQDLILRDELAIDRTLLANERTLIAYLRSGVALIIAGVSIMNYSQQAWFWWVGFTCIPIGIIASFIGVVRFRRMNNAIDLVRKKEATTITNNKKETSSLIDPD